METLTQQNDFRIFELDFFYSIYLNKKNYELAFDVLDIMQKVRKNENIDQYQGMTLESSINY